MRILSYRTKIIKRKEKHNNKNIVISPIDYDLENTEGDYKKKCNALNRILVPIILVVLLGAIAITIIFIINKMNRLKEPKSLEYIDELKEISKRPELILQETNIKEALKNITYKFAESYIKSKNIEKNKLLLDESKDIINDTLTICEISIENGTKINEEIKYELPYFLKNPENGALKIIKSDLELYKNKNEELRKTFNDYINTIQEFKKNIYLQLDGNKEEINKISYQFEETIQYFCSPFIILQKGLKIIDIRKLNENITIEEEYRNEIDELNNLYNILFEYIKNTIDIINEQIKEIPDTINYIKQKIEENIKLYEDILDTLKDKSQSDVQIFHEKLIEIKKSFKSVKEDIINKQEELNQRTNYLETQYRNNRYNRFESEELKNDIEEATIKIENNSYIRELKRVKQIHSINSTEYPELKASFQIVDLILNSLDKSIKTIKTEKESTQNGLKNIETIIDVEEQTSLDLLFVMDLTGSMKPYLEQTKQNILNIIDLILKECPGIDINLGFIGYREYDDIIKGDYVNIEFTQKYYNVQQSIKNVVASGGMGDGPEDVAWGMEMALKKNWKSNAKFIVFVADAPCHGKKYTGDFPNDLYPNGSPNRRNIEDLIKDLACKNISLFCIKITTNTQEMFKMFQNTYNKYANCKFSIVPMNSAEELTEIVIDSSAEVYISERNKKA